MPGNAVKKCAKAGTLHVTVEREIKNKPDNWEALKKDCKLLLSGGEIDEPNASTTNDAIYENLCAGSYSLRLSPAEDEASLEVTEVVEVDGVKSEETKLGTGVLTRPVTIEDGKTTLVHYRYYGPKPVTVIRWLVWDGKTQAGGKVTQNFPPANYPAVSKQTDLPIKLKILEVTKYFAPGPDYMSVKIEIENPSEVQSLLFRIQDRNKKPVYEEMLNGAQVAALRDTDPFLSDPPANDRPDHPKAAKDLPEASKWAQPELAPYTVKVMGGTAADTFGSCKWDGQGVLFDDPPRAAVVATSRDGIGQNQFAVLFQSLKLEFGEWAPKKTIRDLEALPANDSKINQFVQYKLNALGFFAGPVLGGDDEEWKRAVVRYRQSFRDLYQRAFERTADFDTTADYKLSASYPTDWQKIDQKLIDHMKAQPSAPADFRRKTLDTDVIANSALVKELFIDADRYFIGQFNNLEFYPDDAAAADTRKNIAENAWLTRPALPILAKATLRTRDDQEVQAFCPFRVKWDWKDVKWNQTSKWSEVPVFSDAQPSLTREYLAEVETKIVGDGYPVHENGDAPRNTPATAGGTLKKSKGENLTELFAKWGGADDPCKFTPDNANASAVTKIVTSAYIGDKDRGPLHSTQVFFRPSHVAGDTYQVLAQFDLLSKIRQLHVELIGAGNPPVAETGRIENWRRVRVAAYLTWGQGIAPTVNWAEVAKKFAPAYIKVLPPTVTKAIATQADDPDGLDISASFQGDLDKLIRNKDFNYCTAWRWKKPFGKAGATPGFSRDSVYPNDDPWSRYDEVRFINDVVFTLLDEYCRGLKPAGDAVTTDLAWLMDQWAAIGGVTAAASAYFKPKITGLSAAPDKLIEPFYPAGYALPTAPLSEESLSEQAAKMANLLYRVPGVLELQAGTMSQRQAGAIKAYKAGDPVATHLDCLKRILSARKIPDGYNCHPSFLAAMDLLRKRVEAHAKDRGVLWEPLEREDILAAVKDWKQTTVRAQELNISFSTNYQNAMSDYLDEAVRAIPTAECAAGMILVHFIPVDRQKFDAAHQTQSQATVNGVVFLDAGMTSGPGAVDLTFLVAHELGHAIFLKHWKNTSDQNDLDHDQNDQNCILSYSSSNPTCPNQYIRDQYDPHFCGKCVLKLRGWNIRALGLLPERTTNPSNRGKEPCSECCKANGGPCKYLTIVKLQDAWGLPVDGAICEVRQGATVHAKPTVDGQAAFYDLQGDWDVRFPALQPDDWRKLK